MQTEDKPWRYVVEPESGCWLWQETLSPEGYGQWRRRGGERRAHREFYVLHVGPIPEGHHLHHVCATKRCVNPAHLLPVLPGEHNTVAAPFLSQQDRARSLRDSGLSYVAIARELGCSRTTAFRLAHPEGQEKERRSREARREQRYEANAQRYRQKKAASPLRCEKCGAGMTHGTVCLACRHRRSQERKQTIERLWLEGRTLPEIAETLGSTVNAIGQAMTNMRSEGGWNLPKRYRMDEYGLRMPRGLSA